MAGRARERVHLENLLQEDRRRARAD
jgi:hypothetical protein